MQMRACVSVYTRMFYTMCLIYYNDYDSNGNDIDDDGDSVEDNDINNSNNNNHNSHHL